jgi:imidazolonepropionase
MIASTFMGTRWAPEVRVEEYVDWMCSQILPVVRRRGLAEFADISCDLFPVAQVRRYLSVAKQLGLLPKAHAGRTPVYGAIPEAARIGAVSVDHAVMVSEEDVAALAASNTIATLLPGPVFFTGAGRYAPARRLIDEGVAVALATNFNPQTSPSHNMQMMMSLACRKMGMTPAEAMCAATINGAHAMRRADRAGSIEVDKAADIVMFAVSDYRDIPFHFGTNLVEMTLKDGAIVYQRAQVRWPVKPPARAEAPRADTRFSKQRGAG